MADNCKRCAPLCDFRHSLLQRRRNNRAEGGQGASAVQREASAPVEALQESPESLYNSSANSAIRGQHGPSPKLRGAT